MPPNITRIRYQDLDMIFFRKCEPRSRAFSSPTAWFALNNDIRRCRTHRFPYGIIYAIEQDEVLIISVMHLHRHPDSWRRNLG